MRDQMIQFFLSAMNSPVTTSHADLQLLILMIYQHRQWQALVRAQTRFVVMLAQRILIARLTRNPTFQ